jgi:hypothetical protein
MKVADFTAGCAFEEVSLDFLISQRRSFAIPEGAGAFSSTTLLDYRLMMQNECFFVKS